MTSPRLAACAFAFTFLAGLASVGHADLAPPNACTKAGSACNTAGPNYNAPGSCMAKTCTRTLPPSMPGGPPTMSQFACLLCEAAADGGTRPDAGDEGDDEKFCSYGGGSAARPLSAGMGLGLLALAFGVGRNRLRRGLASRRR